MLTPGPLHGVRVLEFSVVYAGPWAGMTLADMGADVIKVEPPDGEPSRRAAAAIPGAGGKAFTRNNRGKRSLALDLRDERAQAIVHRLVADMDVVLINYRPGLARRMRIDYETLSAIRPDLIYAEITGFGRSGALAAQGSTDIIAQSYGGLTAATGVVDDYGNPRTINIGVGDVSGGAAAVLGIVSALFVREATGRGQLIEVSLLRTLMSSIGWLHMRDEATDPVDLDPLREQLRAAAASGRSYRELVALPATARTTAQSPYHASYQTSDGAISLGCLTTEQSRRARKALAIADESGLDGDPERICALLRETLRCDATAHWLSLFDAHEVPAAPVYLPERTAADPQAPYVMAEVHHPLLKWQRQAAPAVELSKTRTSPAGPAPLLGQHNDAILCGLGYSSEEIAALRAAQVVA